MNRRSLILAGSGIAAAVAGVVWQQRRSGEQPATVASPASPASGALPAPASASAAVASASAPAGAEPTQDEVLAAFWQSSFPQPDGSTLALSTLRGKPLVLNFWATWCPPCVKEMPELDRFARQFSSRNGVVLGLAVDNPTAVRNFLKGTPVGYTIALAGFDGTDLSRKLGNTSGALPFTVVFNRQGALVQRKLGTTDGDELQKWTRDL